MKNAFKRVAVSGFTLLELLVVMAIIGILVSILTVNFNEARKSARDDARKSDLKSMQLAIELYKSQNGRYPEAGCGRTTQWTSHAPYYGGCAEYVVGLTPDYIAELPVDTAVYNTSSGFLYKTNAQGTWYKLMAYSSVEAKTISSYGEEFARCPSSCGNSGCPAAGPQAITYAVYSPGAECQ